ncbi:hypothetical protein Tco_1560965 [Tanacetum coccineum]
MQTSTSSFSLHPHKCHPPVFPQGVVAGPTIEDTSITQADLHPSVNPVAGEPSSAQSSSGNVNSAEPNQVNQPPDHLRRWTKDHPLDNIVVNPSRPVSTRKQLASDALCDHADVRFEKKGELYQKTDQLFTFIEVIKDGKGLLKKYSLPNIPANTRRDLPRDNPLVSTEVLRIGYNKGERQKALIHLRQKPGQYICCQNHKLIADIEDDIMDPIIKIDMGMDDTPVSTLGGLLEEIHVTWAHLEKKRTRLQLYTKSDEENAYIGWRRHHNQM